jgi:hypothetical protein
MHRIPRALTIAAAVSVALGAASGSSGGKGGEATKRIPEKDREILRKALAAAMDSIPGPPAMYELQAEDSRDTVDEASPWDAKAKRWIGPGTATAERTYDLPEAAPDSQRELLGPIEMTVSVNGWRDIGDLGSEGGEPVLLPIPSAVAIEISTIVPGEPGGRVAAMTPEQAANRLTELTLAIGGVDFQDFLRRRFESREPLPLERQRIRRPSQVDFIVIRLHGPKKPVEDFSRRIPAAKLRLLLSH